jgi:hypothetical protein
MEDCVGYLYHHATKMEQMMDHMMAKMDASLEEMKAWQKEATACR